MPSIRKRATRLLRRLVHGAITGGAVATALNRYEREFVAWTAERHGTTLEAAEQRFISGRSALRGGYGGGEYRWLNGVLYDALSPFYSDGPGAVLDSYRYYAPVHLLRMTAYPVPGWTDEVLVRLSGRERVRIVDYGCGLAHGSLAVAEALKDRGVDVHLTVVDLDTIKLEFLSWMLDRTDVPHVVETAGSEPVEVGPWDLLVATEFFEHVHDPVRYFEHLDSSADDGAVMVAGIHDHKAEFMHVSPDLHELRAAVTKRYRSTGDVHDRL
ncbi:MAG: class I SAM-dependent methyltransferase [Acidimicrobiales bacterium]